MSTGVRLVAIHAHLYQPPRENPWSESIELQPSAAPLHDWNQRISSECYERLGVAAVRGRKKRIERVVNLFGSVSFDIGPTLASWLARERPAVLEDAAMGDAQARARHGGAGTAIMQPYGHPILPLCSPRERELQIAWGRDDFIARFGREPSGAWLPECAADAPTLAACADAGLRYAILAPEQIDAVRPVAGGPWRPCADDGPPTDRPLLVRLEHEASITAFVFHGDLSRRLAFGGLMDSAESAHGAIQAAARDAAAGGLLLLAADGETFGHHQPGADERLAALAARIEADDGLELVPLDAALTRLEPTHEARLVEPSAWSCSHGVGRWERECGCVSRPRPESWSLKWRAGLRDAVRGLVDGALDLHGPSDGGDFADPWDAARRLGAVLASPEPVRRLESLLDDALREPDDPAARAKGAASLEMLRQALFSATSCGWFFDDIAGIEARQVLRHAARAIELARAAHGTDLEPAFVAALSTAPANAPRAGTGADVFIAESSASPRNALEAAALHGVERWSGLLDGLGTPEPCGSCRGAWRVEEATRVDVKSARHRGEHAPLEAANRLEFQGRVVVQHARTLERVACSVRVAIAARRHEVAVHVNGSPIRDPSPSLRAALVDATARAASWRLGRDLSPPLDLFGRLLALARGAPLPPGVIELSRGAARMELGRVLRLPPTGVEEAARKLANSLRRARAAGADAEILGDLVPRLDRLLGTLVERARASGNCRAASALARAARVAQALCGDPALTAARRHLVRRPLPQDGPEWLRLARALGLEPGAFPPADSPLRDPRSDLTARA